MRFGDYNISWLVGYLWNEWLLMILLLFGHIRWTSWDICRDSSCRTSTCRAVLPLHTLGHHEAVTIVQGLIVVRWCAGYNCGRGGRWRHLLRMNMLTRIRGLGIRRSSFHAVVLIDRLSIPWVTIAPTYCSTGHHIMMCHLLSLLLWMHPIATTHGMRLHSVLRIRVLMSSGFQGITIPSGSAYVLVTISIATHSFCR